MTNTLSDDELISTIVEGIEDVKGKNITLLDLGEIDNTVCNHFVICDGNSGTQVRAIVNSIQRKLQEAGLEKAWHVEGLEVAEWVLMDFVNVVVHVFQKKTREYYDLQGLWGDAKTTTIENAQ